jgi:hypothetical protein
VGLWSDDDGFYAVLPAAETDFSPLPTNKLIDRAT